MGAYTVYNSDFGYFSPMFDQYAIRSSKVHYELEKEQAVYAIVKCEHPNNCPNRQHETYLVIKTSLILVLICGTISTYSCSCA